MFSLILLQKFRQIFPKKIIISTSKLRIFSDILRQKLSSTVKMVPSHKYTDLSRQKRIFSIGVSCHQYLTPLNHMISQLSYIKYKKHKSNKKS